MNIQKATEQLLEDKDRWKEIGKKILDYYKYPISHEGIGSCIDNWKVNQNVKEEEMIDGLGFLFGDLCIKQSGGLWVIVEDQWGETPAIQKIDNGQVLYVLDVISKRLRDSREAKREIQSIAYVYGQNT